jgi:hypothetical protein
MVWPASARSPDDRPSSSTAVDAGRRAAEIVVFLAVAGRDVHKPGARVHRHELRGGDLALAVDPRVLVHGPDEIGSA